MGCVIDITFKNFTFNFDSSKGMALNKIFDMIANKDFAVKFNYNVKYRVLCDIFNRGCKEEEFYTYFKKNFLKIFKFAIESNDTTTVDNVIKEGKLITKRNIDKFIDYADQQNNKTIKNTLENYKVRF